MKRSLAALAASTAAFAAFTASAMAGVATYNSTAALSVPNLTGINGVTSTISVPAGRTAVQSIEVPNLAISWPSGGQELGLQLQDPSGDQMYLFPTGCTTYPNTSNFTITDNATQAADATIASCDNAHLVGGSLKPVDPASKKMSFFSGKASSGNWLLRAIDSPGISMNQGTINTWAVRITHAAPTLTATATKQKLSKTLLLSATTNATGTLTTGGAAKASTTQVTANTPVTVPFSLTKKTKKKIKKKGKGTAGVVVTLTDQTNGTATQTVPVKIKAKKK